jgi:hypothetical protein
MISHAVFAVNVPTGCAYLSVGQGVPFSVVSQLFFFLEKGGGKVLGTPFGLPSAHVAPCGYMPSEHHP